MAGRLGLIDLPESFETRTIRRAGDAGERWLQSIPGTVAELSKRWELTTAGDAIFGSRSVIVPVVRGDVRCALKVGYPDAESAHEAAALETWGGRGAATLYEADVARRSVLIEWIVGDRTLADVDSMEAMEVAGSLLRSLWIPAPSSIPTVTDLVDVLLVSLEREWVKGGCEVPRRIIDVVADILDSHFPTSGSGLVHADLQFHNVFAADRKPWLVLDPKPVAGDLEYAVAPLLWALTPQQLASALDEHFEVVVKSSDLDRDRARQWVIVRTVARWLRTWNDGLVDEPVKCKHIVGFLLA